MCNYNIESKLLSPKALDKAKDAGRKERVLCKQREQAQATEQINLDLTYCVSAHSAQKAHPQAISQEVFFFRDLILGGEMKLLVFGGNLMG